MPDGKKDSPLVTADGTEIRTPIERFYTRNLPTHVDARGSVFEAYAWYWDFHEDPLVTVAVITIRPNRAKGWIKHQRNDDRLALVTGRLKVVLYDDRPDSPTYRNLSVAHFSDHNRVLIHIPHGVYHALVNIGEVEVVVLDMPTVAYRHDDPDKFRLPLDTDEIPFDFDQVEGW